MASGKEDGSGKRRMVGYLDMLLYLGEKDVILNEIRVSTSAASRETGYSQQSVSRKLIEMEAAGLIKRRASNKGMSVLVTTKGLELLESVRNRIDSALAKGLDEFTGSLVSGLGEGSYYVSMDGYKRQFMKRLGYVPYPGTLNIKTEPLNIRRFIYGTRPVRIAGFKTRQRSFGDIVCYPAVLSKGSRSEPAYLIVPSRTIHPESICEFISRPSIRARFRLRDGDAVIVSKGKAGAH